LQWGFAALVFLSAPVSKHFVLPLVSGGLPKDGRKVRPCIHFRTFNFKVQPSLLQPPNFNLQNSNFNLQTSTFKIQPSNLQLFNLQLVYLNLQSQSSTSTPSTFNTNMQSPKRGRRDSLPSFK
jgi:hypothetical protein